MLSMLRTQLIGRSASALTAASVVALLGLSACDGIVENPLPPEPSVEVCAPGTHLETVCSKETPVADDVSNPGGASLGCAEPTPVCLPSCAPDVCPDGREAQEVCVGSSMRPRSPCSGADCAPVSGRAKASIAPDTGSTDCHFECLPPPVEACDAGFHVERVCLPSEATEFPCAASEGCVPEPAGCLDQCVPDSPCGPGTTESVDCTTDCIDDVCTQSCTSTCDGTAPEPGAAPPAPQPKQS